MNLCVQPPEEQLRQIEGLLEGEKICYCAPFDLTPDGKIIKGAFVSVSRSRLILTGPGIQSVYLLKDFARLECLVVLHCAAVFLGDGTLLRAGKGIFLFLFYVFFLPHNALPLHLRVERVAQSVSDKVKRQDGQHNEHAGRNPQIRIVGKNLLPAVSR